MAYRRAGRGVWESHVRTPTGWRQLSLRTTNKALAGRMETMWETLAERRDAWDILGVVLRGELPITRLYDLWVETKYNPGAIRRRLQDVDVAALVDAFLTWDRATNVGEDARAHKEDHLRWLLPEGKPVLASGITAEWLSARLTAYPGARNTRRKVHSSWATFFAWATRVRGCWPHSPMLTVDRPKLHKPPPEWYELDVVERIVGWQPSAERRALYALLYGTGIEVSTALRLSRADVWPTSQEVRAAGTKAHTRDRVARVDDWAWAQYFWPYVEAMLPTAPLWSPGLTRWTVSDWHRQTVGAGVKDRHGKVVHAGLALPRRLKLHAARHSWAVRHLRAGVPIAVVQRQLGHATARETLDTYGRYIPDAADRAEWAAVVAAADAERKRRTHAEASG